MCVSYKPVTVSDIVIINHSLVTDDILFIPDYLDNCKATKVLALTLSSSIVMPL